MRKGAVEKMTLCRRVKARAACRRAGHDWKYANAIFDGDGGLGGGRDMYRYECARCGKSRIVLWPDDRKEMEEEHAENA